MSSTIKHGHLLDEPYLLGGTPVPLFTLEEVNEVLDHKTKESFDRGFKEGSAKGYEVGEAEGRQRAAEEVTAHLKQEFAEKLAAVEGLIREITDARTQLIQSSEREIVALAVQIACRVLGREVEESNVAPELIAEAVRQTMERKHIHVRLNPADYEALTDEGRRLDEIFEDAKGIQFTADASVGRCGCVVESNMGVVDAQIDKAVEQLRQALLP